MKEGEQRVVFHLEGMYSLEETAQLLGIGRTSVQELIRFGTDYGSKLHPSKGGLWPSYKLSHKNRRVPGRAIERHLKHQARAAGEFTNAVAA